MTPKSTCWWSIFIHLPCLWWSKSGGQLEKICHAPSISKLRRDHVRCCFSRLELPDFMGKSRWKLWIFGDRHPMFSCRPKLSRWIHWFHHVSWCYLMKIIENQRKYLKFLRFDPPIPKITSMFWRFRLKLASFSPGNPFGHCPARRACRPNVKTGAPWLVVTEGLDS